MARVVATNVIQIVVVEMIRGSAHHECLRKVSVLLPVIPIPMLAVMVADAETTEAAILTIMVAARIAAVVTSEADREGEATAPEAALAEADAVAECSVQASAMTTLRLRILLNSLSCHFSKTFHSPLLQELFLSENRNFAVKRVNSSLLRLTISRSSPCQLSRYDLPKMRIQSISR